MSDFDRIVRERERAAAERRAATEAAGAAQAQAKREEAWDEIRDMAAAALEILKRSPEGWQTVRAPRRTLFGGSKLDPIAGYAVHSWRYLGKEQTSVTPDHMRWLATVYLLSDGRLAIEWGWVRQAGNPEVRRFDESVGVPEGLRSRLAALSGQQSST